MWPERCLGPLTALSEPRLLKCPSSVLGPMIGMCDCPTPLVVQILDISCLTPRHISLYLAPFEKKRWGGKENREEGEERGERWGGMERKREKDDENNFKGPLPPQPLWTNECIKQNRKQHQTKRAITNHIKDNSWVAMRMHPEAVFTWTAQGVSPVPQGWHGTVLVVLWAWVHPVVPANFHFSSAVHCQFQVAKSQCLYLQQRFYISILMYSFTI